MVQLLLVLLAPAPVPASAPASARLWLRPPGLVVPAAVLVSIRAVSSLGTLKTGHEASAGVVAVVIVVRLTGRITALVLVVAHALGRGGLPGWRLGSLPLRRLPLLLRRSLGLLGLLGLLGPLGLLLRRRRLLMWLRLPLWLPSRTRLGWGLRLSRRLRLDWGLRLGRALGVARALRLT
ncbi:MAG: hypothetical protein JO345_01405 [Streptosporangiaceae bacterium]|nr:hypothetical protein [Streptosporangiaceae bacterium]